ncbi:hypothetical protein C0Q70_07455 [Pomacea canaliculata]|uniref:Uncharacterized protein n=1 Tax=Pomacea canaliculata TaxID=400727 RepID=A0A2T7PF26_POMCA|nr:hypothetical protein C0Q70_07455 [Pomacea canaliculata]
MVATPGLTLDLAEGQRYAQSQQAATPGARGMQPSHFIGSFSFTESPQTQFHAASNNRKREREQRDKYKAICDGVALVSSPRL